MDTYANNFWKNVNIKEPMECWPWVKSQHPRGYGWCTYKSKQWCSHRLAYLLWYHSYEEQHLIKGKVIRHTCDNPICCNPTHLIPGTQTDNMRDKVERNRQSHTFGESHGFAKLSAKDVLQIRHDYQNKNILQKDLAEQYNLHQTTVSALLRGKTWTRI